MEVFKNRKFERTNAADTNEFSELASTAQHYKTAMSLRQDCSNNKKINIEGEVVLPTYFLSK